MKCRYRKSTVIHLLLLFLFFGKEKTFYSENVHYAYNFHGTDLYVNVCIGVFRAR